MAYSIIRNLHRTHFFDYFQMMRLGQNSIPSQQTIEVLFSQRNSTLYAFYSRTLSSKKTPNYVTLLNDLKDDSNKTDLYRRYVEGTKYQEEILNKFVNSKDVASVEDWQCLMNEVFELKFGQLSEKNIDGKIMDICTSCSKLDLARSYLVFMKSRKKKFNAAVVSAFIRLCYIHKSSLTERDKQRIAQFTEFLVKKYGSSGSNFCDGIIQGLLLQNKTADAIMALNTVDEMNIMNENSYSLVAFKLLENSKIDETVRIIEMALTSKIQLSDDVYLQWIELFKHNSKMLEKILNWFSIYDVKPNKIVCDALIKAYDELQYSEKLVSTYGTVNCSGLCSVCNTQLKPLRLNQQEFKLLRSLILDKVLVRDDLFKNSHPQEIDRFFNEIHLHAPFDVVVDGPNLVYITGVKTEIRITLQRVQNVIQYFKEKGEKVCFILKRHMYKWPKFIEQLQNMGVRYIILSDNSEDDAFMLYATIYSGSQSQFVTRDKMRAEKYLLPSVQDQDLFKRWYLSHQIFIEHISKVGPVTIRDPITFQMVAQSDTHGGWHIPYNDDDILRVSDGYSMHEKWLCLQPSNLNT